MLMRDSLSRGRADPGRPALEGAARRAWAETRTDGRTYDHAAKPSGRPDVCAQDPREDRLVNAVVALVLSSFAGFTSAVLAAILGSGLLIAMLVYLGVSVAGMVARGVVETVGPGGQVRSATAGTVGRGPVGNRPPRESIPPR